MVFSGTIVNIDLENDHLVMTGSANESSGCVLRGVVNIHLKQPAKIKSIILVFSGTLQTSWKQATGNGHERRIQHEQSLIDHRWRFLLPKYGKSHLLPAGDHAYDFELLLAGNLPETCKVANFYTVQYRLEASIQRSFLANYQCQRNVYVTRQLNSIVSHSSLIEPISVDNQWSNKLNYEISIPSKLFHHGDDIPVAISFIPLVRGLKIHHLNCTFKEYASCGPVDGLFDGQSKSHSKILYYNRTNQPARRKNSNSNDSNGDTVANTNQSDDDNANPWCLNLTIPIPRALDGIQCDTSGEVVRVRHQLKFVLSMETQNGRLTELRAALPIIIQAKPNGLLPTYNQHDNGQSFPYDPALMVKLLRRNQQLQQEDHINQPPLENRVQPLPSSIDHTTTANLQVSTSSPNMDIHAPPLPPSDNSSFIAPTPSISSLPTYDEVHCH